MIDWLTILIALVIIASLVGFFGFLALKINVSDPLTIGDNKQTQDAVNEKRKKDRSNSEQAKKKRKDQKKLKSENKTEEQQRRITSLQTSEETDDESEQEPLKPPTKPVETLSKIRKRNKNKTDNTLVTTPVPSAINPVEINIKRDKQPNTTRAPPVTHPKTTHKDELEPTKQQSKVEDKVSQVQKKQIFPVNSAPTAAQKPVQSAQKQHQSEQPFTIVGGNRHKAGTPPLQQQQQQQQNKVVNTVPTPTPVQPSHPIQAQHEKLPQRQPPPPKEIPTPLNNLPSNPLPLKQQEKPVKIADLIKVLPSSQLVVTELMSALDAFPLSTDELDIIMHKIANKQSVLRQDWNKLQHGQKVDPQALIGQVKDESAKAYEDDLKANSMKRVKELADELNAEKLRYNVLLKEKHDKEREIQILHTQLNTMQHKHEPVHSHPQQQQQQRIQSLELQLQRVTEDNLQLNHQLQQQQQQQVFTSKSVNVGDGSNIQLQVLSDQVKKLSVDNAQLEKKAKSNELLAKEAQEQSETLTRYNQQLTQSLDKAEKDLKHVEEKHHKQLNDILARHLNETNEYKDRIEQLMQDNEKLKNEDIVHVEPTAVVTNIQASAISSEEREQLEKEIINLKQKITDEANEYKRTIDSIQAQFQLQETTLKQEIEQLKQEKANEQQQQQQINETLNNDIVAKSNEINNLKAEFDDIKSTIKQSEECLSQEREKQRQYLTGLLPEDMRNRLPHDSQDFGQWLLTFQQLFESTVESQKKNFQDESAAIKLENDQLHKNMKDVETQLKEIEKTVQYKEETLLTELKSRDALLESTRNENDQLNDELQRLRNEIQHLQSAYDTSVGEVSALKGQFDDRFLVTATTPPVDSTSTSNADESTALSSSDQQS